MSFGMGGWGWGDWNQYGDAYGYGRDSMYANAYGGYNGGYPAGPMGPPAQFGPPPPGYDQHPLGFGPTPPIRPRAPPPPMFGRRFRPEAPGGTGIRPFEERAMRFLMKCGLTKDFVKKIPREILPMMEPTHCGLCSFEFNSFALSRIHYNSKGHLNAQKKWIQQKANMGGGPASLKEMPLKSRELYCELCDVQITSKVHGDSHYSGRPHKAIVEGRKVPKNPMLLQRGMEKRLEQLIRREKKAYAKKEHETPEGGEGGEETAEVTTAEPKTIIPELYCEICKTAVTCSEQMTMHMNGKKHLSKEKQHILKMMKGETGDDNDDEDDEEYDEDEYEDESGANGGQAGAGKTGANGGDFGVNSTPLEFGANAGDAGANNTGDNQGWNAGNAAGADWS